MNSKVLACIAFLFNTILFGTYYAISKEALGRIDPIIFTFFEMMTLVPAAICILICARRQITRKVLKRGVLLGSSLCLALFTIAIALKYTTATGTAFFPALNGFLAAFIAWLVLRHPIGKATWVAGALSVVGAGLLIANSSMGGMRGVLIAFLGGLFFTCYIFLSDIEQKDEHAPWAIFGIELLTMALWANLVVLLFGDWGTFHPQLPKDIWIILYVAGACTFLPTLITVLMQKYISPVTISFLYILEPVFGAIVATLYLRETLPLNGYLGGGLIVLGAVIHTWGSAGASAKSGASSMSPLQGQTWRPSLLAVLAAPVLIGVAGTIALYTLHGSPAVLASDLYHTMQAAPALVQQGASIPAALMLARAFCWLFAWIILAIMVWRAGRGAVAALRNNAPLPQEDRFALDTRALRHMGVMPHALAASRRKEVRNKSDKPLVQRRRRDRRERLVGSDSGELQENVGLLYYSARERSAARAQFVRPREIEFVE
ncbi:MAG TPA: DMT family transporter [Ktedonobacteraceae bacterium]|nr:DMT family transporter [Ktedonobacteraceae bacterium]